MNIEDFARWMASAPVQRRTEAASALAHAFFHDTVDAQQRRSISGCMSLLTEDQSVAVRRALAETLCGYDRIPKVVLTALLQDVPAVAMPLVSRSKSLDQTDMMTVISNGEPSTSAALAARDRLGRDIVSAIVRSGVREAVLALLANPDVTLADVDFVDIARRLGDDNQVRGALLARDDLTGVVRHMLVSRVSEDLKQLVNDRAWMTPERSRRVLREAEDRAAVDVARAINSRELRNYVATLKRDGRITPALLIRALASGPDGLFEVALAELANVPVARALEITESGKSSAVRSLLAKAGLPPRLQKAFGDAVLNRRDEAGHWGEMDRSRRTAIMLERLMTACETDLEGDLDDMVALLRRMAVEAARDTSADVARAAAAPVAAAAPEPVLSVPAPAAPLPQVQYEQLPVMPPEDAFFSEPAAMLQSALDKAPPVPAAVRPVSAVPAASRKIVARWDQPLPPATHGEVTFGRRRA